MSLPHLYFELVTVTLKSRVKHCKYPNIQDKGLSHPFLNINVSENNAVSFKSSISM